MRQTMRRLLALLCAMAVLFGLTACRTPDSPQETQPALQEQPDTQPTETEAPETKPTDPTPTDPALTDPAPTEPEPTEQSKEVLAMQALLAPGEDNWYNYLLNTSFAKPEEINAYSVFCNGFSDVPRSLPNQEELAYLRGKVWGDNLEKKMLVRLSPERMDEILEKYAGVTLSQVDTSLLTYWEQTNMYYCVFTQSWETELYVQSVEHRDDGSIRVHYTNDAAEKMVAGFMQKGDTYQILFNMPEHMVIDDPQIAALQWLFDYQFGDQFYNDALTSEYATPADVNLFYLFYDGFEDEPQTPTEEENMLLDGKLGSYWRYADLIRLPADKVDAALMEMFGITLEQTNKVGLDKLVYLEETDCYYHAITGTHYAEISIKRVEHQDDGVIHVFYLRGNWQKDRMVVTLKAKGDSYQIISNLPESVYKEPEKLTALRIVEEKIQLYRLYRDHGIACDYEHAGYEDMSRFLTEEQKEDYCDYQYRILCCHTIEDVKEHISKLVSDGVRNKWPLEDKLFTDNDGNLYIVVIPTDYCGYHNMEVLEYSDSHIIVKAQMSDLSGVFAEETFTLHLIDGNFVIVSIEREYL